MTNQEAIETLKTNYPDACYEQLREAVDTAISSLQAQDVPDTNVGDTISRQAAIEGLADEVVGGLEKIKAGYGNDWLGGMHTAWRVLDDLPSTQPEKRTDKRTETHECDYISRQDVVESFTQLWDCVGEITDRDEWEDVCKTTANELPSAQRKGKWIVYALDDFRGRRTGNFRIVCQICGFNRTIWHKDTFPKFCENCGAEMKGEEDERIKNS